MLRIRITTRDGPALGARKRKLEHSDRKKPGKYIKAPVLPMIAVSAFR